MQSTAQVHTMCYILSQSSDRETSVTDSKFNSTQVFWAGDGPHACLLDHAIPFVSLQTNDRGTILTCAFTDKTSVIQRSEALNITQQVSSERCRIQIEQHLVPSLLTGLSNASMGLLISSKLPEPSTGRLFLYTAHPGRPWAGCLCLQCLGPLPPQTPTPHVS